MGSTQYANNNMVNINQRDIVSSTITTTWINIFESVGNGLIVEDIIVTTDGTWLATWTNLQFKANGVLFYSTVISWLWANASVSLAKATVTWTKVIIPAWSKYITVSSTGADCTGSWVATVVVVTKKLDSTGYLQNV